MHYYTFHVGDYASATKHLSCLEDCFYRRFHDLYYLTERPLPADKRALYRLVMARSKTERIAVDSILQEFFTLTPDGYHHYEIDLAIEKCKAGSSMGRVYASRENGKLGGRPRKTNGTKEPETHETRQVTRLETWLGNG